MEVDVLSTSAIVSVVLGTEDVQSLTDFEFARFHNHDTILKNKIQFHLSPLYSNTPAFKINSEFLFLFVVETGFHFTVQSGLELACVTRLDLNSW